MAVIEDNGRRTSFYYGRDTRLDRVLLADGTDIRYHYGHELLPVQITVNGAIAMEYQWADKLKLLRCKDVRLGLIYDFTYTDQRAPVRVMVGGSGMAIYQATGLSLQSLELDVLVDQVDSIRALCLPDGRVLKYIEYDSFGNVVSDSRPEWQFPLGFACGLNDPWTGLIRFGFRDYDAGVGRFTAKDPARDLRGDGDLWDYCVDDPVSKFDPDGLRGRYAAPPDPGYPSDWELQKKKDARQNEIGKRLPGGPPKLTHGLTDSEINDNEKLQLRLRAKDQYWREKGDDPYKRTGRRW